MLSSLLALLLSSSSYHLHSTAAAAHRTQAPVAQITEAEEAAKAAWLARCTAPVEWATGRVVPSSTATAVEYSAGLPTSSLVPPGHCVFSEEWSPAPLLDRQWIGRDTLLLTFRLPDAQRSLGLSTCACLLARGAPGAAGGDAPVRPYTPVSTNEMLGAFQLMVKQYQGGAMSQQLAHLPIGATVDFKVRHSRSISNGPQRLSSASLFVGHHLSLRVCRLACGPLVSTSPSTSRCSIPSTPRRW